MKFHTSFRVVLGLYLLVIVGSGCGVIQTPPAPTPTITNTPTHTHTSTYTPTSTNTPVPTPTFTPTPIPNAQTCLLHAADIPDYFNAGSTTLKVEPKGFFSSTVNYYRPEPTHGWSLSINNSILVFPDPAKITWPSAPLYAKTIIVPLIGDETKAFEYQTAWPSYGPGIRVDFRKGNVLISLSIEDYFNKGDNAYVSIETVTSLAGKIFNCLPATLPFPETISIASEQLDQAGFSKYLARLDLVKMAGNKFVKTSVFTRSDRVFMYEMDVIQTMPHVTEAIYSQSKGTYIFLMTSLPEWSPQLYRNGIYRISDLEAGDYQFKLLVNDDLIAVLPFSVH